MIKQKKKKEMEGLDTKFTKKIIYIKM